MSDVLEISYRLKAWKLFLAMIVGGAAAVGMGYIALNNDAGIRFYHLVTLPPAGATVFFWAIAAICAAAAAMFVVMLASGATKRTYHIRLTPTDFTGPRGVFRKAPFTVALSDIRGVRIHKVNSVHFLEVKTTRGKITINRGDIGKAAFNDLAGALAGRLQAI